LPLTDGDADVQSQLELLEKVENNWFEVKLLIQFTNLLLGFGMLKVGFPGIIPFSRARIVFNSPDIPAEGSECPTLLLI